MERDDPKRFVSTATKAKREKRIFVDYLRNSREATAIGAVLDPRPPRRSSGHAIELVGIFDVEVGATATRSRNFRSVWAGYAAIRGRRSAN